MEVSTTPTVSLKKHLEEILAEQANRRNGNPSANEYLAGMTDETLRDHQLYVMRETYRRDAETRHHAFFTNNTK